MSNFELHFWVFDGAKIFLLINKKKNTTITSAYNIAQRESKYFENCTYHCFMYGKF